MFSLQHRAVRALTLTATLLHTHALSVPTSTGVKLLFEPPAKRVARKHVLLGTKDSLLSNGAKDLLPEGLPFLRWKYLVELADADAGTEGASANWMFTAADGKPSTIIAAVLPAECSRHASPVRPHAVFKLLKPQTKSADVVVVLDDSSSAAGTACAIGRAFPTFSLKSTAPKKKAPPKPSWEKSGGVEEEEGDPAVRISFATKDGPLADGYPSFAAAAEGVRRAARLVDLPPDRLTTTSFVEEYCTTQRLEPSAL